MSLTDDVEHIRAVLRRYSIENVPPAAVTPKMALAAMDRIFAALESAKRLSDIVAREHFHHTEYVGETVDGSGTYSWCRSCDTSWPCTWSQAVEQNAALVKALES